LIDVPLKALRPFLTNRPTDWSYLIEVACRLREKLEALPLGSLDYGFCHGDLHGWNAHIDLEGTVTFFDFDCCAPGWRAYDMATFLWAATLRGKEDERWPLFVQGYKECRALAEADWRAVPLFIGVRHFWYMGYHADEARDLAAGWLNEEYYDREVGFFRQWDNRVLRKMDAG
jgi:Ser/Thr protein kinase RdoA (MazF antagonist)